MYKQRSEVGQVAATDRYRNCMTQGSILGSVDVVQSICEEVSPFYHLFADFHLLTNVPSGGSMQWKPVVIPECELRGYGVRLPTRRCFSDTVAEVTGKQVLELLAFFSPLWVAGEIDEH